MKRVLFFLLLLAGMRAEAQIAAISGFCVQGAKQATVSGFNSSNYLQGLVPFCTVTVYLTGTTTKATLYKDGISTPLNNPFTATSAGSWQFFSATGAGVDVVESGGIPPNVYVTSFTIPGLYPSQQVTVTAQAGGSNTQAQFNNNGALAGSAAALDLAGHFVTPQSVTAASIIAATSSTFGLASGFKTFYVPGDSIGFGCCHTGNVQSIAVATPGSAQTNGTYTISATGGSGYGATASVTIAGGVCTSATPLIPGWSYATTPPTFTVAEGGTPCTLTPTIFQTPFADAVAAALGISGGNYQNVSISGSTTADMASFWMTQAVNANKSTMLSVSETGINEIASSNAGANGSALLPSYQSEITAEDIILSTPYQLGNGALGFQTAAANCTSPWATSTLQDPWVSNLDPNGGAVWPFQMASSTAGAVCSFSVFGTVVNVFYTQTASSSAQATVYIDNANFPAGGSGVLSTMPVTDALALTVSSCSRSGSAVTCTYTGTPAPTTGQQAVLTAMNDPTYNGLFWVTGTGGGTFTFTNNLASASSATGTGVNGAYNSAAFSSFNNGFSRTFIPQVLQIQNLSPGKHTVKVVITQGGTGNNFYLDGASGNQGAHQVGGPAVVQMGLLRTLSQFVGDTLSSTWEQAQRNVQGLLQGQGYPVSFAETRGAVGNNPGGDIANYMLASFTPTGTVTSGSNTITGVSSTSGMGAGIYISDAGVAIPLGSRVASVTSNSITLTTTITGATVATAGSGQTAGIFSFGSSGGTSGAFDSTANGQVLVDGTGACVAAWIDSPGNFTLTPTLNSPSSGGVPCTLTPVFSSPTATATETLRVFSQQPHPDYGHAQVAQAVLSALNFNRPPNQQQAAGAAIPINGTTGRFSGAVTATGLTNNGTSAFNGQTTITSDAQAQAPLFMQDSGTSAGPFFKSFEAAMPGGIVKQLWVMGQSASQHNAALCNFGFTSLGSTSNFVSCGVYGDPVYKMDGAGNFYLPHIAASSGTNCLQIDNLGIFSNTGAPCATIGGFYTFSAVNFCDGVIGTANAQAYWLAPSSTAATGCASTGVTPIPTVVAGTITSCTATASVGGAAAGSGTVKLVKFTWSGTAWTQGAGTSICTFGVNASTAACTSGAISVAFGTTNGLPDAYAVSVTTGQATDTTANVRTTCAFKAATQ